MSNEWHNTYVFSLFVALAENSFCDVPIIVRNIRTGLDHLPEINWDDKKGYGTSFRFCSKPKFLLYHVTLVSGHTATLDLKLPNACAVQVSLREELIHVKEIVEDRWSARAITSGISQASSAGELVVRGRIDSECILTCWFLRPGCRRQLTTPQLCDCQG